MEHLTDYGHLVWKSFSLHGQKSNPDPKFLNMAEAHFRFLQFMPSLGVLSLWSICTVLLNWQYWNHKILIILETVAQNLLLGSISKLAIFQKAYE